MSRLNELQTVYDLLSQERGRVIGEYDRSLDGSPEKRFAVRRLNELGSRIQEVEREIQEELDATGP